ncbi:MAG: sporulation protein [Oscillospiraceae bacterium]|jgi:hypothetical protein|nr:sporulation protein [Oscillospiraceae bacterium]
MTHDRFKRAFAFLLPLACTALAVLLVLRAPLAMEGARGGLALCGQVIIPSLYPFYVLGGLYTGGRRQEGGGRGAGKATNFLFRQPPAALGAILLGFLGGYPLGAKAAAQLMERGALTRVQAQRLQIFCVNAGPAYLIGAVGAGMLGSRRAGLLLFASLSAAGLVLGLVSRFWQDDVAPQPAAPLQPPPRQAQPFSSLLLHSVSQATASILAACAWVVLFATLCSLLRLLPNGFWPALPFLNVILEVSSGMAALVRSGVVLPVCAAALGWGGLAVHCQTLAEVRKTGLPLRVFWVARALHGALAAAICWQLCRWFPAELPAAAVAGAAYAVRLWAVSAPAAAAALFFCAFLILDIDLGRKL